MPELQWLRDGSLRPQQVSIYVNTKKKISRQDELIDEIVGGSKRFCVSKRHKKYIERTTHTQVCVQIQPL